MKSLALALVLAALAGCASASAEQTYRERCWEAGGYVVETPEKMGCFRPGTT